jgi:hypothetical protein
MTEQEIRGYLCIYDPQNPDYFYDPENEIGLKERPDNCTCDNCFYGRHKLAEELLKYREAIKDAWELGAAYGTAEDNVLPEAVEEQRKFLNQL